MGKYSPAIRATTRVTARIPVQELVSLLYCETNAICALHGIDPDYWQDLSFVQVLEYFENLPQGDMIEVTCTEFEKKEAKRDERD